jgi:hypothetical protein
MIAWEVQAECRHKNTLGIVSTAKDLPEQRGGVAPPHTVSSSPNLAPANSNA